MVVSIQPTPSFYEEDLDGFSGCSDDVVDKNSKTKGSSDPNGDDKTSYGEPVRERDGALTIYVQMTTYENRKRAGRF